MASVTFTCRCGASADVDVESYLMSLVFLGWWYRAGWECPACKERYFAQQAALAELRARCLDVEPSIAQLVVAELRERCAYEACRRRRGLPS